MAAPSVCVIPLGPNHGSRFAGENSISQLATRVLSQAPAGRFALAGLSMGGYVALEIMRQAPERVSALALLDTSARPDTPEATQNRKKLMQRAETDFPGVIDALLPKLFTRQLRVDLLVSAPN
ncbi:alpha/beta fold hydrolase [Chitinimonas sp. BJB300]|uniref:alpha/beta fold hydrolase n=1 Tax=Chitinimonas sp. BJB300 TaxID=1559339 RepID=UPI0018EBEFFA|nr:alpha/beta hydrolase [Chitinimonas sp. BJB300]